MIQRRIRGKLVQKVLGAMTLAQARREAQKMWRSLRPATPVNKLTLGDAWQQYLDEKPLAPKTQTLYRENFQRYLGCWGDRTLEEVGEDRAGVRRLYLTLRRDRGVAIAAQIMRQLPAV